MATNKQEDTPEEEQQLSVMRGFGNTAVDFTKGGRDNAGSSMKINGSRVKVAVRIRPLLNSEMNAGHKTTSLRVSEQQHQVS